MADMSFDVVFCGGGYGALMSAPYFCMNGMSVGIFEALPELGGGHASDARPVPGFTGNPHAHAITANLAPQVQDFKLHEYGAFLRMPKYFLGGCWTDGSGYALRNATTWDQVTGEMTFDYDALMENYEAMARISKVDADTCKDMAEKTIRSWMYAMMMDWLNPPKPWGEKEYIEKLFDEEPDLRIDPRYQFMTLAEISRDIFYDKRFQFWYARICCALGFWPDRSMCTIMTLLNAAMLLGLAPSGWWEGGTHQVVHALQRLLAHLGAKSYVNHPVDKIIVENGKAKGIVLADGTQVEAKQFVCTNVDPRQLTFRFLRDFNVSDRIKKKLNEMQNDSATLFWGNIAHHEPAKYIAEEMNPHIPECPFIIMGDDDMEYFEHHWRYTNQAIRPGKWPDKMYFWAGTTSLFDQEGRLAPPGKYNTLIEELGPPASAMSERDWLELRREIGPHMVAEWQKFAPNMTDDNIIGIEIDTPGDFARRDPTCIEGSWMMGATPIMSQWGRFRPIEEFSNYKVPGIDNLYCTGIGWHSNYGSPAGFAYNMYKQCAWDHGLKEFWKEAGREW